MEADKGLQAFRTRSGVAAFTLDRFGLLISS
jgi:hypothetical protein